MRSEPVGLVEVRNRELGAAVTHLQQQEVAHVGDGRLSLRGSSRTQNHDGRREGASALFSTLRSIMASWRSEKPKSAVTVEYVEVSGVDDDGENGAIQMTHHKPRQRRTCNTLLLGLALL